MHMDLDAARDAGFSGGFFALYVPSPRFPDPTEIPYAVPLPDPIPHEEAARIAEELFAALCELPVQRATSSAEFRAGRGLGDRPHGGGGADRARPLEPRVVVRAGPPVDRADVVAAERVRGGCAVPLPVVVGYGRRADRGRARARCGVQQARHPRRPFAPERAGFWDVARLSDAPLVATHSNAHALCAASRNLTDGQLDAIRDSGGVVGVNFAVAFLREDGREVPGDAADRDRPAHRPLRRADGHRPRRVRLGLRRRGRPGRARRRGGPAEARRRAARRRL